MKRFALLGVVLATSVAIPADAATQLIGTTCCDIENNAYYLAGIARKFPLGWTQNDYYVIPGTYHFTYNYDTPSVQQDASILILEQFDYYYGNSSSYNGNEAFGYARFTIPAGLLSYTFDLTIGYPEITDIAYDPSASPDSRYRHFIRSIYLIGVPDGYPSDTLTITADLDRGYFASVPEPASWAMMIAGFGMVGGVARRRGRGARERFA